MFALAALASALMTPPLPVDVAFIQRIAVVQQTANQLSLRQPTVGTAFLVAEAELVTEESIAENNRAVIALEKEVAETFRGSDLGYLCDGIPCRKERYEKGTRNFPTAFGKVEKNEYAGQVKLTSTRLARRNKQAMEAKMASWEKKKARSQQKVISARAKQNSAAMNARMNKAYYARANNGLGDRSKMKESPMSKMNKGYLAEKVKSEKVKKSQAFDLGIAAKSRVQENREALSRKAAMDG